MSKDQSCVFGEILNASRKKANITLEKLAKKVRSSKGYLSGIENGKVNPPTPKFTKTIAIALGLPVKEFMLLAELAKLPDFVKQHKPIADAIDALHKKFRIPSPRRPLAIAQQPQEDNAMPLEAGASNG
jgi:transcriptional regulator with XRE-family HTH domain